MARELGLSEGQVRQMRSLITYRAVFNLVKIKASAPPVGVVIYPSLTLLPIIRHPKPHLQRKPILLFFPRTVLRIRAHLE